MKGMLRVLIVDEDLASRQLARTILARAGWEALDFSDAAVSNRFKRPFPDSKAPGIDYPQRAPFVAVAQVSGTERRGANVRFRPKAGRWLPHTG